jgi:hypothetical protein
VDNPTAIHEAGHGVVAEALGFRVLGMHLNPNPRCNRIAGTSVDFLPELRGLIGREQEPPAGARGADAPVGFEGTSYLAYLPDDRLRAMAVVLMAGWVAASRVIPWDHARRGAENDLAALNRVVEAIQDSTPYCVELQRAEGTARALVNANWPTITTLACALLDAGALGRSEVEEVLRTARQPNGGAQAVPAEESADNRFGSFPEVPRG